MTDVAHVDNSVSAHGPDAEGGSIEVLAVRIGSVTARKSALFYGYAAHGEPDADQVMDYFFWVLRGQERTIVVDTGFEETVAERRGRTSFITPLQALGQLGIDPSDVDDVIVTHFHYDHIGNVDIFPNARILVAAAEFDFYTSPLAQRHQVAFHVEADEIAHLVEANDAGRVTMLEGTAELIPGVSTTVVGGHAPGQVIVTIENPSGEVVLASDAVHLYEELDKDRPFHVLVDLPGMYETFDLLRERERAGAVVLPGHDPEVTTRFPLLDPERSEFAYKIA